MTKPKLIQLSSKDQDALIERIQTANLPDRDKEILTGLIEFNNWLQFNVQEKNISINRLQNIFGNSSEKSNRKKKSKQSTPGESSTKDASETENSIDPDTLCPITSAMINTMRHLKHSYPCSNIIWAYRFIESKDIRML